MKKTNDQQTESALKRFLKKKVAFTASLLVSFLITGGISLASSEELAAKVAATHETLIGNIQAQKAEIQAQIDANNARLAELNMNTLDFLNEGDWYSKAPYASYFLSLLTNYTKADSDGGKKSVASDKQDTDIDISRREYSGTQAGHSTFKKGTGWIMGNQNWNDNTLLYDNKDDLVIIPVVKPPEILEPTAPQVTFTVPAAPTIVQTPSASIPNIAAITLNVTPPAVTLPGAPTVAVPNLNIDVAEQNISVAVNPVVVTEPVVNPTFYLTPAAPTLNLTVKTSPSIENPTPTDPTRPITIAEPSAKPFTEFAFNGSTSAIAVGNSNMTLYSGIDPNTIGSTTPTLKKEVGQTGGGPTAATRPTNILYRGSPALSNINVYVAGYDGLTAGGSDGSYNDAGGSGAAWGVRGTIAFHTLLNGTMSNINGYLYGRAGLMTSETWRHGKVTMSDTNVEVRGKENAVFYIMPAAFSNIIGYFGNSGCYVGGLLGSTDVQMYGSNNSVYLSSGISGPRRIENSGNVQLEGASNIVYTSFSYAPNFQSTTLHVGAEAQTSAIKLTTPVQLYGDEDVVLFFGSKIQGPMPMSWETSAITTQDGLVERRASYIGIYQGEIQVTANIGTQLAISSSATAQTTEGQLTTTSEYTSNTVDGAIGIYSRSGQRTGISPMQHLGVPHQGGTPYDTALEAGDPIHSLQVGNLDIRFGEYSKNGFMIVSQLGTVIDIGTSTTNSYVTSNSTSFSDGINGAATVEADAATGTIIAYASGRWDQSIHQLGTALGGPMSAADPSLTNLINKPSEVNIHIPLTMTSKEGIAYMTDDYGIVNVDAAATTTATGHKSIIGFAKGNGQVNIAADIIAQDAGATSSKYENIGAYAGANGTVTVTGNATIDGIGAFANGANAKAYLNGTANIINTGVSGGLVGLNGGYIEFKGGTLTHKNVATGDHDGKYAFFADGTSKLNFTGATTVDMYNGVLYNGVAGDYAGTAGTTTKYNGMSNVTFNLMADGINLGVINGTAETWTGLTALQSAISTGMGGATINGMSTHDWTLSLTNGSFDIVTTTDYNTDKLINVILEKEDVTIGTTGVLNSSMGNSLVMGSNSTATSNGDSTVTNNGAVNITGGTPTALAAGLYVSYGQITNGTSGTISVDNGVGAYGVNGSKLVNNGTINITASGVGLAGLSRRLTTGGVVGTAEGYGTDAGATGNVVEIENHGTITVTGNNGVGIYADNNTGVARNKVLVSSDKPLTLGNGGIGVMVKGSTVGGTITLTGTGSSDIVVGTNGMGIYVENSDVNMGVSYGVEVKDGGVGIYTKGNSNVNLSNMEIKYTGSTTGNAAGIYLEATGTSTFTNSANITVNNVAGTTGTIAGIYAKTSGVAPTTDTLTNSGSITSATGGSYGIIGIGVDINNTGLISMGTSSGAGGVGLFGRDSSITAAGDTIKIEGTDAIGIYAENTLGSISPETVAVSQGTNDMAVNGTKGIGIFVSDKAAGMLTLNNSSNIILADSGTTTDRRMGIILTGASGANTTSGTITVGKNNVGIFNKNSTLTNTGIINVTHNEAGTENIGIHNSANGGSFVLNNTGVVNVNGVKNIGISAESDGTNTGVLDITGGAINITATSLADGDIPIGIYTKGNKIKVLSSTPATLTVGSNAIGVYMEGDNTSTLTGDMTFSLSSDTSGKVGIGGYFINGAYPVGPITVTSTATAIDGSGNKVRPIGIYFGSGSTVNSAQMTVAAGSDEAIGMYTSGLASFTNNGNIIVDASGIGAYYLNSNIVNAGQVDANAANAYGLFFKGGTSSSTGIINANGAQSIGVISSGIGTSYENHGTVTSNVADSIGMAAVSGGFVKNVGTITVNNGYGAVAKDTDSIAELAAGSVNGTPGTIGLVGVAAIDGGEAKLNGGNIAMDDDQIGIYSSNAKVTLSSGNIAVGNNGIGVYAKNNTLDAAAAAAISMGISGIAIYSEDSTASVGSILNVNYTSPAAKGVGIYYKGVNPVTNNISIAHTGNNLVNIYADGLSMTNAADQTVQTDSIGIYGTNNASLNNTATLSLVGTDAVGIYVDGGSTLGTIGTIIGSSPTDTKVGVYVANGDVTGSADYNFGIAGGVGMYLQNNVVSYTGKINVLGDSPSATSRTIGIYADPALTGTIATGVNVTAADAIGIYLADNGTTGANIIYTGDLSITGTSTGNRGLGAYLASNTTFTLSGGNVDIGGTNNIGFYVSGGSTFNVSGGTVTNTIDGIFAFLDGGVLNFAAGSMPNINYANVIVSGSTGNITNDTAITVGNGGLQGDNGAAIVNSATGTINGTTQDAKAMIGTGTGTTLTNAGNIALTGDGSVGMYVENGATGTSTGNVAVGNKSVSYFAGQGGTLNISGTETLGEDSTVIYAGGGSVNYTGAGINVGNKDTGIVISDAASTVDMNGKDITAGQGGTGIYATGTGDVNNIVNIGTLTVGQESTGIYLDIAANANVVNNITLNGQDAIGVLTTQNGDITYGGTIISTSPGGKGIVSQGTGTITNNGTISLIGGSGVGIYGENSLALINNAGALIDLGDGTSIEASVGMYGKPAGTVKNDGTIHLTSYGVGMYGENSAISNTGTIINGTGNNTGIYGVGGSADNTGNITLGDTSNGMYVKDGAGITNTGDITVGDTKSAGIYGSGTTPVALNGGTITVGKDSVGIATDSGAVTSAATANIITGEGSTAIYTASGTSINDTDLTLGDYVVGMYTKTGSMINNANITVGLSDVSTSPVKVSVGMAAETGTITNKGKIDIGHDHGVGMAATKGGTAINDSLINVDGNNAYGMEGVDYAILINNGTIYVNGDHSRGITGINHTAITNTGTINVNGTGAEGVYIETGASVDNQGNIVVNGADRTGIFVGEGGVLVNAGTVTINGGGTATVEGTGNVTNVGDIEINGPTATIDGVTITNTGTITVNGPLDFGTVKISGVGTNEHIGTISAETFNKGEMIILSDITKGQNKDMYIVQYLHGAANVPNNGAISAISQSVSYIVDLQKDPDDSNKISIVLVKVPYGKILKGTKAESFGQSLDELYEKYAMAETETPELRMFNDLKVISDDDELASTFETELRGNEYANIQDRMMDINDVFDSSYNSLKHDRIYTKDSLKIGAIVKKGESKYRDPSILDYDMKTLGFMLVQEHDTRTYGKKWNWDLGFTQNKFDFDDSRSDETVYSVNFGLGYEQFVGNSKHTKWMTRGVLTGNHHDIDRRMTISGNNYKNDATYYSGTAIWKNKIKYENESNSGVIKYGIGSTLDLGVGRYFNIKEDGDGMRLDLPSNDFYTVRPGVETDVTFTKRTKKGIRISFGLKGSYEYELGRIYDGGNDVRFIGTKNKWELEKPKKEHGIAKVGAEMKVESKIGNSIGFEVMRREGRRDSTTYGGNFMIRLQDMSLGKVRR